MMNYKVYILVAALVGSLFLSSCKVDHGKPPVDKEEMISLLVDVHIAQSLMMREKPFRRIRLTRTSITRMCWTSIMCRKLISTPLWLGMPATQETTRMCIRL